MPDASNFNPDAEPKSSEDRPPTIEPTLESPNSSADGDDDSAEQSLWTGRTHWKHFAGRLIVWGLASIAYTIAMVMLAHRFTDWSGWTIFWLCTVPTSVAGALLGARIFWRILGQRYRLTDQRLFIERGVLSQTIDQTELIRVDDVRVRKSVMDRIFGLGNVEIMSTDVTDAAIVLEGIQEADRIAEIIRSRMRTLRKKSLFIETL